MNENALQGQKESPFIFYQTNKCFILDILLTVCSIINVNVHNARSPVGVHLATLYDAGGHLFSLAVHIGA